MSADCNCGCGCGCSETNDAVMSPVNRPGLPALAYRVGTHGSFFEAMKARLSTLCLGTDEECREGRGNYPLQKLTTRDPSDPSIALLDSWAAVADVLTFYQERIANEGFLRTAIERRSVLELARLIGYTLRPGVASSVYLAYTLDEDRSFTPAKPTTTLVPKGSRVQSIPGPGELPQSFETSEDLDAHSEWNKLPLRMTRPQTAQSIKRNGLYLKGTNTQLKVNDALLVEFGAAPSRLQPMRVLAVEVQSASDRTLITLAFWQPGAEAVTSLRNAAQILQAGEFTTNAAEKKEGADIGAKLEKTADQLSKSSAGAQLDQIGVLLDKTFGQIQATLQSHQFAQLSSIIDATSADLELARATLALTNQESPRMQSKNPISTFTGLSDLIPSLEKTSSIPPANRVDLARDVTKNFTGNADGIAQALGTLKPELAPSLYRAWSGAVASEPAVTKVYAFRITAPVFGYNAPPKPLHFNTQSGAIDQAGEWPVIEDAIPSELGSGVPRIVHEDENIINLDTSYDKILPGSWVIVETAQTDLTTAGLFITHAQSVNATGGRSQYGITGKTTRIELGDPVQPSAAKTWIQLDGKDHADTEFAAIRRTTVYAQGEELALVEEPIDSPVGLCDVTGSGATTLELSGLYEKLTAGRWLIVSGERVIPGTTGVTASELVMLGAVENAVSPGLPGDKVHTFLKLGGEGLAYCYKRDTVTIYGNVVNATHGETRVETANGDARKVFQEFALKQFPLTFVSSPTPAGAESTLQLRVNDVLWHETDTLADQGPTDHRYVTRTDDDARTTAITGDGKHGARLPTGQENIKLTYRNGIGQPGNVKARQISLLVTRPLNVKEVVNPLPATGGADRESRDLARVNAPLAVQALDRLVGVQDYADFTRTFAGIAKATAASLSDGERSVVHVTIAGVDDIPIAESSDLFRNLNKAIRDFGDPFTPFLVQRRQLLLLVLQANVRVLPDYLWTAVEPNVRAALLDYFSFARRDLGQDALLSEVFSTIQAVEGVAYVDVDVFDALDEAKVNDQISAKAALSFARNERIKAAPATVDLNATDPAKRFLPAQLASFTPDIPDTLILTEIKP